MREGLAATVGTSVPVSKMCIRDRLRWIALPQGADALACGVARPPADEFSGDDEPLAWEADGWEAFR